MVFFSSTPNMLKRKKKLVLILTMKYRKIFFFLDDYIFSFVLLLQREMKVETSFFLGGLYCVTKQVFNRSVFFMTKHLLTRPCMIHLKRDKAFNNLSSVTRSSNLLIDANESIGWAYGDIKTNPRVLSVMLIISHSDCSYRARKVDLWAQLEIYIYPF